ncbi:MAG: HD domain-containing protein [Clostridiales bacterium]|nr:HD domain-containing protein [Clostridiales bacterium]
MDDERLERQFEFLLELDKEKNIDRQTYLADGKRKENDAEHAWHMAVMALVLSEYSNENIDILKTVSMILIHDVVEIYAGDTYAYDEEGKKDQKERETNAADRLFSLLPEDQGVKFRQLWNEFEERKTPESKFANTLDNVQPSMLNNASEGRSWKEHKVTVSGLMKRQSYTCEGSEKLWNYALSRFIMPNIENGTIIEK